MIALLVPAHSLAVLASTKLMLAVLIGDSRMDFDGPADLRADANWVASVIGGAYIHGDGRTDNMRRVFRVLNHTAGIPVSLRTARALVEDIEGRIG